MCFDLIKIYIYKTIVGHIPILTKPLLLNNVPKCGPDKERNVCNRGRIIRSWGRDNADRTIIVPNE